jgi:phosphoglycerate dehydrogenase-like enzyme
MTTTPVNVLVLSNPQAPHLKVLEPLHGAAKFTITDNPAQVVEAAPGADVILNAMFNGDLLRVAFPLAKKVRWIHTISAGVESVIFPELIESPVPLTNGRGVFRRPLGEFVVAAALYFAKDLRRMLRSQEAGSWDQFDVEELHGRTLGIIGFGEIGRAAAERAKPFGMQIIALRRRPDLSGNDSLLDAVYPPSRLHDLLRASDYIAIATPSTPETRGMIGDAELAAMKPTAVIINVGRGPVIVEAALVRALQDGRIRGAALDVFDQEPLPAGHPFWTLKNVLLSPHCADHTVGWLELAIEVFVRNFDPFVKGEPFENVVDKRAGY